MGVSERMNISKNDEKEFNPPLCRKCGGKTEFRPPPEEIEIDGRTISKINFICTKCDSIETVYIDLKVG